MKNSEIASAIIGGTFFAIPYLALSLPILPSLAIGACAFAAGEMVLKKDTKKTLKETNLSLYHNIEKATKDNKHILEMIPQIEEETIKKNLKEIHDTVNKIIKTIEKNPEKEKELKNFFDYYLPVTVKLVDKFNEIENQNIKSKESKKFYQSISKTIEELKDVYMKFQNNLYSSDMLDTNIEIKILNSMLKSDGLDENEIKIEVENNEQ